MRSSTKRILSILFSGIFFIGVITVFINFVSPALSDVMEKRSVLFSKEQFLSNQTNIVNEFQSIVQEFQQFPELRETVELAMPTTENTTQILSQLDVLSRSAGVFLEDMSVVNQTFQPSDQSHLDRLGSMQINVNAEGSYENIKDFMEFLETNVRVFNITRFIISPTEGFGPSENYQLTLTVETFFQES